MSEKASILADLLLKGLAENPERVNKAIDAQSDAAWAYANMAMQFFTQYGHDIEQMVDALPDPKEKEGLRQAIYELEEQKRNFSTAQDEFLKAMAGQ